MLVERELHFTRRSLRWSYKQDPTQLHHAPLHFMHVQVVPLASIGVEATWQRDLTVGVKTSGDGPKALRSVLVKI